MILYLRVVPGLGIAVEEGRRSELRSHPVLLLSDRRRSMVREANFIAQRQGVRPGMAATQARQICPDATVLRYDPSSYSPIWEDICDAVRQVTPLVEPVEPGQLVADLTGCERLWGDRVGSIIAGRVAAVVGAVPWIGLSSNRLTAQLASLQEGITRVETGMEALFLSELPITLLPGLDARLALTFQVLGLKTIGDFAALPRDAVRQRFKADGVRLHAWACGKDDRPVVPPPPRPSVTFEKVCEDGTIEEARQIIRLLADRCAQELQERGVAGMVVELTLRGEEYSPRPRPLAPPLPERRALQIVKNEEDQALPIPYRVHSSRLPQPGVTPDRPEPAPTEGEPHRLPAHHRPAARVLLRTPVQTAAPLTEAAERLLLREWNPAHPPQAIVLRVSDFPSPTQLSLLDNRIRSLAEEEQILIARYGDSPFRHVERIDPGNILAERQFRWERGMQA
ncbi:MAG TPA: hypothetical protein VFB58_00110 [Chloroflexota bacterium]|nr:hypothetical protein [Chloroflexota bacterium]